MKHKDYWRKRFEQLEEAQNNKSVKYYLELEKQYKLAMNSIEKDILSWYNRFAENEGISLLEAKKLLNTRELEEFKWNVEEYIKYGKENAINQKWMKELENASARLHITRLEALKLQIQQHVEVLYGNELDGIDKLMRDIYTSGYYHTAFNVQQGVNVGWSLMSLDTNRINKIISKPWATDGLNFSERIWGKHRPTLINELHTKLTQSIIRGENPKNLVNDFAKRFNVSKSQAKNLIMTESAFFASASRKDCFSDLDVEKYEIIATLDLRTSNICRELDGKVFDMKDYQVGITAPPFHCRCRTTTAPFFSDEEGYRAARDENGKTYYVPVSMKYKEWYEKYVNKNIKLSDNEQLAINKYISSDSYKINEKLRNGLTLTNEDKRFINDLDSALDKMPNYKGEVNRSLYFFNDSDKIAFLNKHQVGKEIIYNEYISTSSKGEYNSSGQVELNIISTNGKDIRKYNPQESEILFKRNSKFITTDNFEYDGKYYIIMKEV
ncbi:TPA: minor capsid protein [Clostridioides difficile]|uniref:minor capsid protein n=1 Tax=Clostridioides difficile TaxID=1496 RepID=UPI000D1ED000|nr:minor capsid protein [Clostridioides difficile]MCM4098620.1 minor capsid protein [Clostridioides difficile]MCZ1036403.1 minor capsid protein [Clostridioides difficile]MDM0363855.1 minor capsid protein [Clostridioides difficile]MDM0363924.1 minor capsid protein [Clostridioides difficile]MDM9785667.1 minor capsid protein [Clostridioides difficile]